MKISIPVEFNGFGSYEDIFKQFEPKKMCKKFFLIGENQKSDSQIFFFLVDFFAEVVFFIIFIYRLEWGDLLFVVRI